jgi:alanine-glyoxylate transaminase/serine-glyoxylate transaminase/serine-pyruvate transaminase
MNYALREALRLAVEEGLEARFARHRRMSEALGAGLDALGLGLISQEGHRLPMMNTVTVPEGADAALVQKRLLTDYKIEVLGGLGPLKGKIWRVGLMGHSCQIENVLVFLAALEEILSDTGAISGLKGAAAAAARKYRETIGA